MATQRRTTRRSTNARVVRGPSGAGSVGNARQALATARTEFTAVKRAQATELRLVARIKRLLAELEQAQQVTSNQVKTADQAFKSVGALVRG